MTKPTVEEFAIYKQVQRYLEHEADLRSLGCLSRSDSVFANANGDARVVVIGGSESLMNDAVAKYEEGYYLAASVLVEWASDRIEAAGVVYPILFVSRHALELSLKKLIAEVFEPVPKDVGDEHNVTALWDMLLNRLREHHDYAVPRNALLITKLMSQMTEIDPKSMSSRYAKRKDFKTMSIPKSRSLNLRNLQTILAKLYNELYDILNNIEEHRRFMSEEFH